MSILGVGVDLVKISDLRNLMRRNPSFLKHTFTPSETELCDAYFDPAEHYATRFAAKEAFYKALPQSIQDGADWLDIQILPGANGRPEILPSKNCQILLQRIGIGQILLSTAHESEYAVATVILAR